ncbi:hypothetical protein KS4_04650 [Poriferisphaera corsica]|uniref:DUF4190 domain-containing protein n=1 Tax=Poriferisphaera corsica TaxID=2528020 RepID=A0A517YQC8_9BACT|nr:hypothetical protein [Poriferisphaera corsica]QDU32433.1 hypothetical protein KS4_04650 [Poriferisphaera corsica]
MPDQPTQPPPSPPTDNGRTFASGSLALGFLGLLCSCIPIGGFPLSLIALVFGIIAKARGQNGIATTGIILAILGLIFSIMAMFSTTHITTSYSFSI